VRKSNELGIDNLKYLQADILDIHDCGKQFDIIETVGVLHHMDEPMAGWSVLSNLLKPGGLMKVGLYSKLGRSHIRKIRNRIAALEIRATNADIRSFRSSLIKLCKKEDQKLIKTGDFFSLSALRDAIFHVQEHCFTIPEIQDCLNKLELKFCGFEDQRLIARFKKVYGKAADIHDLELWHKLEKKEPDTFEAMYQFWCQKV
jgi:SAM-dependent methyltransferase